VHTKVARAVGHGYAGSVITGVADQRPAQLAALLCLGAFVPEDGDFCWSMINDEQRVWFIADSTTTGLAVDLLLFFDDRARPHSAGHPDTEICPYRGLQDRPAQALRRRAVAPDWRKHSLSTGLAERLCHDPDWDGHRP
jgi:hypothetical protein